MWNAKVIAIHMEDSAMDFRPDLKKLDVPTLFIHGLNAHRVPAVVRPVASLLPDSTYIR